MGWFWDTNSSNGSPDDAYSKLDAGLKDFLDKGTPPPQSSSSPPPSQEVQRSAEGASTTYRSQLGIKVNNAATPDSATSASAVPRESLYQDGRYAHLWKGYRSLESVETSQKSDQDRLADVVDTYRDRKAAIGRAALENCVMQQLAEKECYAHGGFRKMMGMCRAENKEFNRCYVMQSRFLKALGYLSSQYSTADEEERIQMHADKLFQEMIAREKVIEEAKQGGYEAPAFAPLIQQDKVVEALGPNSAYARGRQRATDEMLPTNASAYSQEKQDEIRKRLKGLNEHQKEIELQLIAAESRAQLEYADMIKDRMEEERVTRADRRDRGRETFGDTIKRWWGWEQ